MPSSPNKPGPHDRKAGVPRPRCVYKVATKVGHCKRYATKGLNNGKGEGLCNFHWEVVNASRDPTNNGGPTPARVDLVQSALSTSMVKKAKSATAYVIDQQARRALDRLRNPAAYSSDPSVDPRLVLLDSVNSAWRQRQVWEAMLGSIPEADFEHLGEPPLPGSLASSKGARVETIQRLLSEATKVAARTSKLAIDAGIEERLVRLAEEQERLIADTVRAGIMVSIAILVRELRLAPTLEAKITNDALHAAAGHLRILASGGPEVIDGVARAMPDKTVLRESAAGNSTYRPIRKKKEEAHA